MLKLSCFTDHTSLSSILFFVSELMHRPRYEFFLPLLETMPCAKNIHKYTQYIQIYTHIHKYIHIDIHTKYA